MTILVILILLIFIICGILFYQKMENREGFEKGANTELSTCPLQSVAYLAKNGDTLCCQGPIVDGECTKPLCALAQRSDMPSCKAMLDEANKEKTAGICPPSLPNYYTDGKGNTGCTDGPLNDERTAPMNSWTSKTCKVYDDTPLVINGKKTNYTLNDTKADSCNVKRQMEMNKKNMEALFGTTPITLVPALGDAVPSIIGVQYNVPGNKNPQFCWPTDSLYYFATKQGVGSHLAATKEQFDKELKLIQSKTDPMDCVNSKAIYLDKSTTLEEVSKKEDAMRKSLGM